MDIHEGQGHPVDRLNDMVCFCLGSLKEFFSRGYVVKEIFDLNDRTGRGSGLFDAFQFPPFDLQPVTHELISGSARYCQSGY